MQRASRSLLMIVLLLCMACAHLRAAVLRSYPTAKLTVSGAVQSGDGGGNIQVDFNGFLEVIHYGPSSTASSLASGLAAMFTRDYRGFGLYAKAGASGGSDPTVVTFQLTNGSNFGTPNVAGPSTSFSFSESGFGGSPSGTPDVGTVALQFNGATVATARYGEGSTPASIAAELAQTANSGQVTVTAEGPNVSLQTKQTGTFSSPYSLVFTSTQSGFSQSSFSASPSNGTLTGSSGTASIPVYSYAATYDHVGNVLTMNDSVMGSWDYSGGYDNLNRLTRGQPRTGPYTGQSICWGYDSFGNRTSQSVSTTQCGSSPPATFAATYTANNQIASVSSPAGISISYDAAGNVTSDGYNTYLYDAEGRVCAVHGPQGMTGYLYNAEGDRVGKGTIANMNSCDPTQNGFVPTNDYVLDQSGGQMTEVAWANGTAIPQHTNVTANGVLIATADSEGWHFHLNDPLGSRRVQADAAGFPEQSCQSLPFGDQLFCTGSANFPTEHHFTGKERDTESGLDYFGARYYASSMGRFMSPDWAAKYEPVPYAKLDNPQTLNLFAYVDNNPLSRADADGHDGHMSPLDYAAYAEWSAGHQTLAWMNDRNAAAAARAQQQSHPFTVTLNGAPGDFPGGGLLDRMGIDHEWITTSDGAAVGMEPADPATPANLSAYGTPTALADQHGRQATTTKTFTNVDKDAINSYLKVGTPTGRWTPPMNDCNTWAEGAIRNSTPHDIIDMVGNTMRVTQHNVVVYADGSIHSPGQQ